jgi:1-acyl-sn-glycerol-3-phosphate acyltransferase
MNAEGLDTSMKLDLLKDIHLTKRPKGQLIWAKTALWLNYEVLPKIEIVIEGEANLPQQPVILVMNHTDRYNCWPFQYAMQRKRNEFMGVWVKAKYYQNTLMSFFLRHCHTIPLPSKGYLLGLLFRERSGRLPTLAEYRDLRDWVDGFHTTDSLLSKGCSREISSVIRTQGAADEFERSFGAMMSQVTRLNRECMENLGHHVFVFPQGTRSKRLLKGRTGMMQMAQHLGATIVPVGCNGSDYCYSGNLPWAKRGQIIYRVGEPISLDSDVLKEYRVPSDVLPLSRVASQTYAQAYEMATQVVMERLNDLLEPEYQADPNDAGSVDMKQLI